MRGTLALNDKHYHEAEKEFAQAEADSPGATNALALRAKALLNLNRFEEAEQCLGRYIQSHPSSPDGKYLMAYVLFRRGRPRESLEMYTAGAALSQPTAEDFKIVGLDYVLLNDYSDAIRWLERSVSENPNEAEAVYHLGRAYYVENNFDKAIAAFERALQLNPEYVKAEDNLGLALAAKGQVEAAETAYRKAMRMAERSAAKTDQPYINLSDLLSHTERKAEALALLDEAERIGGVSEKTAELRGRIFFAQNRLPDADTAFRAAIALAPANSALHYLLGRVLKQEGKPIEAEKEFAATKSLLGTSSSSEAKESALKALQSGDKDKALAILVKAREAAPNDPELLYDLGFVAYQAGLYHDAETSLNQALRLRPGYPDATYALARTYLAESKAAQAESEIRKYVAEKPEDATAQYGLGYILMAEERIEEAKAAFEKSLALQPDQTESVFQLGEVALQQGDAGRARENFKAVLARDPRHGGALTEMGVLAYRAENYEEARSDLQRATESAPSYQKAHYYYALTLTKLGQKAEAEREFTVARGLQKEHGAELRLAAQP